MTETPDTPQDTQDTTGQEDLTAVPQGENPEVDAQDNDEAVDEAGAGADSE